MPPRLDMVSSGAVLFWGTAGKVREVRLGRGLGDGGGHGTPCPYETMSGLADMNG